MFSSLPLYILFISYYLRKTGRIGPPNRIHDKDTEEEYDEEEELGHNLKRHRLLQLAKSRVTHPAQLRRSKDCTPGKSPLSIQPFHLHNSSNK